MATAVSVDSVEKEHPWMIQTGKGTKVAHMAVYFERTFLDFTFKTDRLDLRKLDLEKMTTFTHYLKISACKRNLLYMQNTVLKV